MNTKSFLQGVVADKGFYCIWASNKKDNKVVQKLYLDLDEITTKAEELDAKEYDVYFACATFKDGNSRKVSNVHSLQSFFLDIDCGEEKDYPTQEEAIKQLNIFCKQMGLPPPLIVNSGRGIHVYWKLTRPVLAEDWIPVAENLKKATHKHKLLCDHAVTADAARILRIPSTRNHKTDPPLPTGFFGYTDTPAIDFEVFSDLVEDGSIPVPTKIVEDFSAVLQKEISNRESFFKDILKKTQKGSGCAQIEHVMLNPDDVNEPLWFDAISVVKHCVDGGRKGVHRISQNYSKYDTDETDNKYDTTKYVHRCETFNDSRPNICPECPHWGKIGSPIVLGQRVKEASTPTIPKYPQPYFRGANGGVYIRTKNEDGDVDEKLIYHNDLYVVKRVQDFETGEGIVMRLHLPVDGVREFTIPLTAVTSREEFRKQMSSKGVAVTRIDDIMNYTTKWVNELQETTETQYARRQFGWTDDEMTSFVLGDKEIFADKIEKNPESTPTKDLFYIFKPKGTLEEWKQTMEFYNRDGFELHQYIICTSFGSPLMALSSLACSGLHVHSAESGVGKTTAMLAGAGVWGNPEGLMLDKQDTQNSRMLRGEVYKNLPLYIDEMTNATPAQISEIIYQISGGKQKNRMAGGNNLERLRGEPWSLNCVTTGNVSMIEKVSMKKAMPKAEAQRMLETKAVKLFKDTASKQTTDEHLTRIKQIYGHAGVPYIQYVIRNIDEVKRLLMEVQKRIDKATGLTSENRFWSIGVAATITGAILAVKLGLINFNIKKLRDYSIGLIEENKIAVSDMSPSVQENLNNYIFENWGSILKIKSTEDLRKGQDNGLDDLIIPEQDPRVTFVGRYEPDTKLLFLVLKPLKKWCGNQDMNYNSFISDLEKHMGAKKDNVRITKGMYTLAPSRVISVNCSSLDIVPSNA